MSRTADELTGPAYPGECGVPGPGASAPAGNSGGLAGLQPFRHRAFTLLWTAGLISTIGSWMQTVAVGALVISDTGKATWAVLVAAGGFLPIGLLSLFFVWRFLPHLRNSKHEGRIRIDWLGAALIDQRMRAFVARCREKKNDVPDRAEQQELRREFGKIHVR